MPENEVDIVQERCMICRSNFAYVQEAYNEYLHVRVLTEHPICDECRRNKIKVHDT